MGTFWNGIIPCLNKGTSEQIKKMGSEFRVPELKDPKKFKHIVWNKTSCSLTIAVYSVGCKYPNQGKLRSFRGTWWGLDAIFYQDRQLSYSSLFCHFY